jgi:hypothetical protein
MFNHFNLKLIEWQNLIKKSQAKFMTKCTIRNPILQFLEKYRRDNWKTTLHKIIIILIRLMIS